jgi:hypothetical protein
MPWNYRRPLPGSIEEAAQKIERLMELDEQHRRRPPAKRAPLAEPTHLPRAGLLAAIAGSAEAAPMPTRLPRVRSFAGHSAAPPLFVPLSDESAVAMEDPRLGPKGMVGLFDMPRLVRQDGFAPIPALTQPQPTSAVPEWLADVGWDTSLSPTSAPIDVEDWLERLGFDPEGPGQRTAYWQAMPGLDWLLPSWLFGTTGPLDLRDQAVAATNARFQSGSLQNSDADAYRHALWAYLMTRELGMDSAKLLHDGHEITEPNDPEVRLMDVFNSRVGMELALDPTNAERSPEDVIAEALNSGLLQTSPFSTLEPQSLDPGLPAWGLRRSTYDRLRGR